MNCQALRWITVVLAILKLSGALTLAWPWVFLPTALPVIATAIAVGLIGIVCLFSEHPAHHSLAQSEARS